MTYTRSLLDSLLSLHTATYLGGKVLGLELDHQSLATATLFVALSSSTICACP